MIMVVDKKKQFSSFSPGHKVLTFTMQALREPRTENESRKRIQQNIVEPTEKLDDIRTGRTLSRAK